MKSTRALFLDGHRRRAAAAAGGGGGAGGGDGAARARQRRRRALPGRVAVLPSRQGRSVELCDAKDGTRANGRRAQLTSACRAACVATVLQGGERGQGGGAGSSAVGRHAHTPRVRGETVSWELPQLSWVTSRSLTHDTMYYVSCLFCLVSARVDCEFLLRPSNHAATHDYLGRCNLR